MNDSPNTQEYNHIQIISEFPNNSVNSIAGQLHEISKSESAMLERSAEFYINQIENKRIFIAMINNHIIGSVWFLPLSDDFAEISGAWVHSNYRNHGVYAHLRDVLEKRAKELSYRLVSTNKPSIPENAWAHYTNFKRGVFPVKFSVLKILDLEAYENCCCCDDNHNHRACPSRDVSCFLMLQNATYPEIEEVMTREEWKNAVPESVQKKIHAINSLLL